MESPCAYFAALPEPRNRLGTYQPQTVGCCHRSQTTSGLDATTRAETGPPFSSDVALQKLVYLTIQNLQIKWKETTYNRKEVTNQLTIIFEERIKPHRFD